MGIRKGIKEWWRGEPEKPREASRNGFEDRIADLVDGAARRAAGSEAQIAYATAARALVDELRPVARSCYREWSMAQEVEGVDADGTQMRWQEATEGPPVPAGAVPEQMQHLELKLTVRMSGYRYPLTAKAHRECWVTVRHDLRNGWQWEILNAPGIPMDSGRWERKDTAWKTNQVQQQMEELGAHVRKSAEEMVRKWAEEAPQAGAGQ